jgi:hypothetical protein
MYHVSVLVLCYVLFPKHKLPIYWLLVHFQEISISLYVFVTSVHFSALAMWILVSVPKFCLENWIVWHIFNIHIKHGASVHTVIRVHTFLCTGNHYAYRILFMYLHYRTPDIYWIGGWVGPRTVLDNMAKWKFLTLPELELQLLDRLARSQSLYQMRYRCSRIFISDRLES